MLLNFLCALYYGLYAGTNGRYELLEPLLSLQRTLASALDMPNAAVTVLLQQACLARKSGRLTNAMGSLHALQSALRCFPFFPAFT